MQLRKAIAVANVITNVNTNVSTNNILLLQMQLTCADVIPFIFFVRPTERVQRVLDQSQILHHFYLPIAIFDISKNIISTI